MAMASFTQLPSGNWRVQVRRKNRYVSETFRRRKEGEDWAFDMERNIDRNGSSKPRVVRNVCTFGDLIDLHDEDTREVGKSPRGSKAAVMASLKTEFGGVKPDLPARLLIGAPFNADDPTAYYGRGEKAYTDYPSLEHDCCNKPKACVDQRWR